MNEVLPLTSSVECSVVQALQAVAAPVQVTAPRQWTVTLPQSGKRRVRVRMAEGLLELALRLPTTSEPSPWPWLTANAALGGLVKFITDDSGTVGLRGEIPVVEDCDLVMRLWQVSRVLGAAEALALAGPQGMAARFEAGRAGVPACFGLGGRDAAVPGVSSGDGGKDAAVPEVCEAAGWGCTPRRDGRWAVRLDTRRGCRTAVLRAASQGVCASVELADWEVLSPRSLGAVGLCLMRANTQLRLTRACVAEDTSGGQAFLEVRFDTRPTPAELGRALEALSVGADFCGPEVDALQTDEAAGHFLCVRGGPCTLNQEPATKGHT